MNILRIYGDDRLTIRVIKEANDEGPEHYFGDKIHQMKGKKMKNYASQYLKLRIVPGRKEINDSTDSE